MDLRSAIEALPMEARELKTRLPGQTEPVYAKSMTLADHDKIKRYMTMEGGGDGVALCMTIIHMLTDKDGKKVFTVKDKRLLMERVPNAIMVALVNEISEEISLEEAEGN